MASSGLRSMIRIFSYWKLVSSSHPRCRAVTYSDLVEWLAAERVVYLVLPVALYPREDILLSNVLYLCGSVVLGIVFENHALNFVLCSSKPTLLDIFEDDLQACLWAGDVACVSDGDTERPYLM
jgi:hypothetical protein